MDDVFVTARDICNIQKDEKFKFLIIISFLFLSTFIAKRK